MGREWWLGRIGSSLWKTWESENKCLGVVCFEVASLISKVVHICHSLSDDRIDRLRDETLHLPGVRKLVSDDENHLLNLALAEFADNLAFAAGCVVRLGRRCDDPVLRGFDHVFEDLVVNLGPRGAEAWEFSWKKMKRKAKKMERLVAGCANLYQEMEVLSELELGLRRMQMSGGGPKQGGFVEFQRKVVWQRQEVKYLRENSLWNMSYDYVVRLLGRALFTLLGRMRHVFGIYPTFAVGASGGDSRISDYLPRSQSLSSRIHSSSNNTRMFVSGPLGGPGNINMGRFTSGPLEASATKSGLLHGPWRPKTKRVALKGCMTGGGVADPPPVFPNYTSVDHGYGRPNGFILGNFNGLKEANLSLFSTKLSLLSNPPPSTLGEAALALHYANVIIVIEKMVTCPHLIAPDARDDLYSTLPRSIRAALRARLKTYTKNLGSSIYDGVLAAEWNEALTRILEWLSPLAHNMIRWQSERNFEQQRLGSKTNVLLLQTLYFANQAKTEAAITELLVGLNYICRVHGELNSKALLAPAGSVDFNEYLDVKG